MSINFEKLKFFIVFVIMLMFVGFLGLIRMIDIIGRFLREMF